MENRIMKDSGVDWIGNYPENWKFQRVKNLFTNHKYVVGSKVNDFDRLALTLNGVIKRSKEDNEGLQPTEFTGYQILRQNELVFKLIDLQNISTSRVGLSSFNGIVSPAYIVLKAKHVDTKFGYYFFYSMWQRAIFNQLGDAGVRSSLNASELLNLPIVCPTISEQKRISAFLDQKCSDIDSLMADIQQQIDTLEQYKKSIVTEAVTKGLNPDVAMKDSGIEWIGVMPHYWNIERGKYILEYIQKPTKEDDGVITCFRDGEVTLRSNRREDGFTMSDKEIGYQGIDIGDLVVHGMDGFAGAIGISDSRGKASPVLNVLDTKQNKKYIMYYLRSMAYSDVFLALATGIRVRSCDLRWNKLADLFYPVPPIEEQNEIAEYIENQHRKINDVISDKQSQLSTLENYKKSLIYEYVTGKKEVPNE